MIAVPGRDDQVSLHLLHHFGAGRLPALSHPRAVGALEPIHAGCESLDMTMYLGYFLVMIRLNIHEAKTHLSRYLPLLEQGETIILCKRNVPIAEIKPIEKRRTEPRELGFMRGQINVTDAFFEPLPDDLLAAFEGGEPGEE